MSATNVRISKYSFADPHSFETSRSASAFGWVRPLHSLNFLILDLQVVTRMLVIVGTVVALLEEKFKSSTVPLYLALKTQTML